MSDPAAVLDLAASGTKRTCAVLIFIAIAIGAGLRTTAFLFRPSYWNDEAAIVVNVERHDCRELTGPLEYAQAAPPLFLWIERGLFKAFGPSEWAMRSLPFSLGLIVLPLFGLVAWRRLPPTGAVWAVAFFACSDKVIPATNEVKQYSADLFMTVVMLWAASPHGADRFLRTALVAVIGLWISFPIVFVFAAVSAFELFTTPRRLLTYLGGNALVVASFGAMYAFALRRGHAASLDTFWAAAFPQWHRFLPWLAHQIFGLASYPIDSFGFLTLPFLLIGILALARKRRWQTLSLLPGALVFAFLAAALRRYPFVGQNRLSLYLLPVLFLFLGAAAEPQDLGLRGLFLNWYWLLISPLLAISIVQTAKHVGAPEESSVIRPVADYLRLHRRADEPMVLAGDSLDPLAPPTGRNVELLCYWPRPPGVVIEQFVPANAVGAERFWVVYSLRRPRGKNDFLTRLLPALGDIRVLQTYQQHEQSGAILVERQR